jgi:hypothetical protein
MTQDRGHEPKDHDPKIGYLKELICQHYLKHFIRLVGLIEQFHKPVINSNRGHNQKMHHRSDRRTLGIDLPTLILLRCND